MARESVYQQLTNKEVERFTMLLVKMVKLQRLMAAATQEQQVLIQTKASGVIEELVRDFGGDQTWCECLLTFGGQYFGQGTEVYVGDGMDDEVLKRNLHREICRREKIEPWL